MADPLLTRNEIVGLDRALIKAFQLLAELREAIPIARHIKNPAVPQALSESIAAAAAAHLFGQGATAVKGSTSDLVVRRPKRRAESVEVKGIAAQGFHQITDKDVLADVLLWVDFGPRYADGEGDL